jgi:hypothetical protein
MFASLLLISLTAQLLEMLLLDQFDFKSLLIILQFSHQLFPVSY